MKAREECRRVAAILEGLDAAPPDESGMEAIAAHLESCPDCGVADAGELLGAVAELAPPLPSEEFFAASADRVMAAVRREPVRIDAGSRSRRAPQVARPGAEPARRRMRLAGTALALAAGVALVVGVSLVDDSPKSNAPVARVETGQPAAVVVSVDGLGAAELAASEDAWLVASSDFFDLEPADTNGSWTVENLSDAELEALEGMFGSAPGLG